MDADCCLVRRTAPEDGSAGSFVWLASSGLHTWMIVRVCGPLVLGVCTYKPGVLITLGVESYRTPSMKPSVCLSNPWDARAKPRV